MRRHIFEHDPDVVVLTEAHADFAEDGHVTTSSADYGLGMKGSRRKVVLWSKWPLSAIDQLGHPALPPGRFVLACFHTPLGPVNVAGVCIPWSMAHVATGRRDRAPWDEHLAYLAGLGELIDGWPSPKILAGDFNQAIPRHRQPKRVASELERQIGSRLSVPTADGWEGGLLRLIDHVAISADFAPLSVAVLPSHSRDGVRLSDHTGAVVKLGRLMQSAS